MTMQKDSQGWIIITAAVCVVIGIFAIRAQLDGGPKPGADNCVGNVNANTVIVLDRSEQVTDQTLDEIRSRAMDYITKRVKVNERVSIFSVSAQSERRLRPILSLCRPPDSGSRLVANVKAIQRRFQEQFDQPLREALSVSPGNDDRSPIAQTLTDISLSQYLRGDANALLIFSDMLENSPQFTLYRCQDASKTIADFRLSRRGAMERPRFKNTSVVLNLIPRLDQSPEVIKCRDALWMWFFGDNEGSQAGLNFDYLPGGARVAAPRSKAVQ
jgi:hypothetical protein